MTDEKIEHTPTPYTANGNGVHHGTHCVAIAEDGEGKNNKERARANAAFIARACNSHDALVEALSGLITLPAVRNVLAPSGSLGSLYDQACAALRLAGAGRGNSSDGVAGSASSS